MASASPPSASLAASRPLSELGSNVCGSPGCGASACSSSHHSGSLGTGEQHTGSSRQSGHSHRTPRVRSYQTRLLDSKYQLGEELGRGSSGRVYRALNRESGHFVAVKEIPMKGMKQGHLQAVQSEIELLHHLQHPQIVRFYETIRTSDHLYLVLEYVENGSLANILKLFGKFPEHILVVYMRQVLQGLEWLHSHGVCHRDIKGANLLITKDGQVKLADFGVAGKLTDSVKPNSVVGTPYWMAPEIIEMSCFTTASDIWSLGCTVLELLTGEPPYFELRPVSALYRIVQDGSPPLPASLSPLLHGFLTKCFTRNPEERATASELRQHPWLLQELPSSSPASCAQNTPGAAAKLSPRPNTSSAPLESRMGRLVVHTVEMSRTRADSGMASDSEQGTHSTGHGGSAERAPHAAASLGGHVRSLSPHKERLRGSATSSSDCSRDRTRLAAEGSGGLSAGGGSGGSTGSWERSKGAARTADGRLSRQSPRTSSSTRPTHSLPMQYSSGDEHARGADHMSLARMQTGASGRFAARGDALFTIESCSPPSTAGRQSGKALLRNAKESAAIDAAVAAASREQQRAGSWHEAAGHSDRSPRDGREGDAEADAAAGRVSSTEVGSTQREHALRTPPRSPATLAATPEQRSRRGSTGTPLRTTHTAVPSPSSLPSTRQGQESVARCNSPAAAPAFAAAPVPFSLPSSVQAQETVGLGNSPAAPLRTECAGGRYSEEVQGHSGRNSDVSWSRIAAESIVAESISSFASCELQPSDPAAERWSDAPSMLDASPAADGRPKTRAATRLFEGDAARKGEQTRAQDAVRLPDAAQQLSEPSGESRQTAWQLFDPDRQLSGYLWKRGSGWMSLSYQRRLFLFRDDALCYLSSSRASEDSSRDHSHKPDTKAGARAMPELSEGVSLRRIPLSSILNVRVHSKVRPFRCLRQWLFSCHAAKFEPGTAALFAAPSQQLCSLPTLDPLHRSDNSRATRRLFVPSAVAHAAHICGAFCLSRADQV
mmetsp:Transcript_19861/g.42879  ORF Transcript_19861/g.42879 Transcript_19861/m.42879 type:complete len:1004 (-) Transcript_19861:598-3609(-)